jgi:hypothetical protein
MFRSGGLVIGLTLALSALGCGSGVKEEQIEIKTANDPLFQPRSILQRYAEGQMLGSEVTSFPKMVEDVRATDPARADVLEKGLQELQQAAPGARPGKAKKLLEQLQPSMG